SGCSKKTNVLVISTSDSVSLPTAAAKPILHFSATRPSNCVTGCRYNEHSLDNCTESRSVHARRDANVSDRRHHRARSGPAIESHIDAIRAAMPNLRTIFITHRHGDHAPAAVPLKRATGAR